MARIQPESILGTEGRMRVPISISRRVAVSAMIGVASLLSPALARAVQPDTASVVLLIDMNDEQLTKQLESYFRRELRSLGHVTVVGDSDLERKTAMYRADVLGVETRSRGGAHTGYALTIGLSRNCFVATKIPDAFPTIWSLVLSADSVSKGSAFFEILELGFMCYQEVNRQIVSRGREPDWLRDVRGWVAEWDTDFFEHF